MCDCETMDRLYIRNAVVGYGRSLIVYVDFKKKTIATWYDHSCDSGTGKNLDIKFCPLCGRELNKTVI